MHERCTSGSRSWELTCDYGIRLEKGELHHSSHVCKHLEPHLSSSGSFGLRDGDSDLRLWTMPAAQEVKRRNSHTSNIEHAEPQAPRNIFHEDFHGLKG